MKCPKCGYLGFEDVERCRNCGYNFSLVASDTIPEFPLRSPDAGPSPLDDLALVDAAASAAYSLETPNPAEGYLQRDTNPSRSQFPTAELPLFGATGSPTARGTSTDEDDAPLITKPSPPRPPLAVRRATAEAPRLRPSTKVRPPMLDLGAFDSESASTTTVLRPGAEHWPASEPETAAEPAGVVARLAAALVDLVILLAIDATVVYLTMEICGIALADLRILPKGPLVAFLVAQNLGYFIGFTVGGQTLGKMATGIKVVSERNDGAPDWSHSVLRTLVWVALVIPAGLGFLTTLGGREHRGLHDRCAGTKVVRASS